MFQRKSHGGSLQVDEVLRERMEQNSRTSLLKLSAQSGVALSTCQKIVKKRLNLHPYKMSLFQELKPADYPRRVAYCSWFLNNMNDNRTLDLSFFSDKAPSCCKFIT
jgi:hypothetical protein